MRWKFQVWDSDFPITTNLERLLEISLPLKPTFKHDAESREVTCCICYSERLNGEVPSRTCDNSHCGQSFHILCLYEVAWWVLRKNYNLVRVANQSQNCNRWFWSHWNFFIEFISNKFWNSVFRYLIWDYGFELIILHDNSPPSPPPFLENIYTYRVDCFSTEFSSTDETFGKNVHYMWHSLDPPNVLCRIWSYEKIKLRWRCGLLLKHGVTISMSTQIFSCGR